MPREEHMPRTKTPPSIKDEKLYEELRKQGDSKEKAARISNASAAQGRSRVGRRGGCSGSYDSWTVPDLRNPICASEPRSWVSTAIHENPSTS
jgi:hypothetical protein